MSLTTWLDATCANIAPLGTIDARWNADRNVSVVSWRFEGRVALLGEAPVQGAKLAKYRVLNCAPVIARLRKLEADAVKAQAKLDAEADADLIASAEAMGIDLSGVGHFANVFPYGE